MVVLSPGSAGRLTDPDGRQWTVGQGRLGLLTVRRLLARGDIPVLLGEGGGLHWVAADGRPATWKRIRDCYAGPGGKAGARVVEYMGYQFVAANGDRLLYVTPTVRGGR